MSSLLIWYRHVAPGLPRVRVGGLSLVQRAVLTGQAAGYRGFEVAVHPDDREAVEADLRAHPKMTGALRVFDDPGDYPACAPGDSDEPATATVIALGDRVWLRATMAALVGEFDAARVRVVGNSDQPAAGLVRFTDDAWREQVRTDAIDERWMAALGVVGEVPSASYCSVSDGDYARAETMLIRSLTKPADGVISRNINRKISGAITRRLARFHIIPNHVTVIVGLIGLGAVPLGLLGTYIGFALAGLCYYFSAVLDGVDGELSRLKFMGSPMGAWFDTITDDVVGLAWLVGMYGGLIRITDDPLWLWFGAASVACYIITLGIRYYVLVTRVGSGDHQKLAAAEKEERPGTLWGRFIGMWREIIFRTDFLPFYAAVAALAGYVQFCAVTFGVGAAFALIQTVITLPSAGREAR